MGVSFKPPPCWPLPLPPPLALACPAPLRRLLTARLAPFPTRPRRRASGRFRSASERGSAGRGRERERNSPGTGDTPGGYESSRSASGRVRKGGSSVCFMAAGDGAQLPATIAASRSVEKALEEAAASGVLNLSSRKLKEFPRTAGNHDLSDITHADLSKNRLCEMPEELCHFISLETLSLYHNGMRSLSSSLGNLQALTYLNLSRNLLSSLPPPVFQLPLLRVLIISNNKLSSLPASIHTLTYLRQLDVSCNDLQCLPAEIGQLECLRDLNLRRNQLTTLPEEIAELPLVRLDVSCNRISHVPVCYRHLRHLQSIWLDNNPLQLPPAQICSKGKYHIFKYLNIEACKRNQEELERHLRPTGFNSCLSEHELFSGQFGGLDSGFNSVDSGSKRWSGNESADDFSERSLRIAEVSRDQRNLEEEVEEDSPLEVTRAVVNGGTEQVDFIDSSVTEEEDCRTDALTPPLTAPPLEQTAQSSPSPTRESSFKSTIQVELGPPSSGSSSPSSPSLEEKRRPGTLLIWQERERQQQQREKAKDGLLLKPPSKTGSHLASSPQTGSHTGAGSPENNSHQLSLRQRCASADQMSVTHPPAVIKRSVSKSDVPSSPKASSPPGQVQKPNSFLFRVSSRCNVKATGSAHSLEESGRSESRTILRSPKEERPDVEQLRKILESRLKITLPVDLGEALSNGTVLCQLANHLRPRSVSIIHIPSPAVPKLSAAKCRLNIENFITACRKLGVQEDALCPPQLIQEEEGLSRLAQTVQALVQLQLAASQPPSRQEAPGPTATA
ncbi:leucine-rich repeat and calponin homology domain-containing protein 4 isoform X2 [Lampris incognitus]|uniref:leucine-rich repeat and calponin homology domain-containing protein 4 isoform X2 n=1 Tax=Lampris incognitus TaxID=2546036 RepID=UPI0024B555B4|nr:leucine-rich repeat and calponin homology domain-containing protein 4 isoform X2 [Lampris incognitus]XP_056156446.1 leucine-rich repeat and calponin homology domain-containing protein 4 isoform X2 [Lampris incognitus]